MRMLNHSGIGTYIRNVVPRVTTLFSQVPFTLLGDPELLERWTQPNITVIPARADIYSLREQLELPRIIPNTTDLLWCPHFNVPALYQGKLLVTIHDVFHLAMPQYFEGVHKRLYARFLHDQAQRKATKILSVSDFTKAELVKYTGADAKKIESVPLGVDAAWFAIKPSSKPHPKPYVVFVGNVKPHKNVLGLMSAFASIRHKTDHDLLIVGQREGFTVSDSAVAKQAEVLGERVRFTGWVEDAQLRQFVAHASALVFPSFYEGFGLPPLEAMAAGVPVLVSDKGPMPAVCAEAALYCDPYSHEDMAAKLLRLLTDSALRSDLTNRGLKRAKTFTWDACAEQTATIIEGLL